MTECTRVRRLLGDSGVAGLRSDRAAEEHVASCDDCFELLEAVAELDGALHALPVHDASDEVVQRLLASPELEERGADRVSPSGLLERMRPHVQWLLQSRRRWVLAAAPAAGLLMIVAVSLLVLPDLQKASDSQVDRLFKQEASNALATRSEGAVDSIEDMDAGAPAPVLDPRPDESRLRAVGTVDGETGGFADRREEYENEADGPADELRSVMQHHVSVYPIPEAEAPGRERVEARGDQLRRQAEELDRLGGSQDDAKVLRKLEGLLGKDAPAMANEPMAAAPTAGEGSGRRDAPASTETGSKAGKPQSDAQREPAKRVAGLSGKELEGLQSAAEKKDEANRFGRKNRDKLAMLADSDGSAARSFLAGRDLVDGLELQEARGYWSNTYVPGDRELRRLQARLAGGGESMSALHGAARRASQPFDLPENAALAVYLRSDRAAVSAESRMLLQVGLQATHRHGGRRPAMNVAVVLDLRGPVAPEHAAALRALVVALSRARDTADRFHLVVAGRPGGVVLQPGDFRHGPVTVALGELLGDPASPVGGLDLVAAVETASELVAHGDDPSAPLGSSLILLVTAQPLGDLVGPLEARAHASAVEGVPVSAVAVGQGGRLEELDRVVLAGQGNRRLLLSPADAEAVVDRELAAVGRVVARAVRLNIRLAPGVRLVDVIGSYRLDEARAQAVRDAELSIDQRLSRNLGLQADRGLDDDGIQIVIPSFYAGDHQVVLLDVVTPGPGPVAEVTMRHKDLVAMKNGVARASLSVRRGEAERGPLELAVLRSLLGVKLGQCLETAAAAVAAGDAGRAVAELEGHRVLLAELAAELPGLGNHPDLVADAAMVDGYLSVLGSGQDEDAQRAILSDSLRYAGRLKRLPPPPEPAP